jgi:hypothetical protein
MAGEAAAQGHYEAKKLKTQIENEKFYFGVSNDTSWDIVSIRIYHNSEHIHSWEGRLLSSIDGGGYRPVIFPLSKGNCTPDYDGRISFRIEYKCNVNGSLFTTVKEASNSIYWFCTSLEEYQEREQKYMGPKIYLDAKFF